MNYVIDQVEYNDSLLKQIKHGMSKAANDATGIDEWHGETFCFVANYNNEVIGTIVIDIIYGQMRIEYMLVDERFRHQGIGSDLLNKGLQLGIASGCTFAFLETLNFQAPEFYEKHGFLLEFSRPGFKNGIIFHYYRKNLELNKGINIEIPT